jgi:hypothetical protein
MRGHANEQEQEKMVLVVGRIITFRGVLETMSHINCKGGVKG